MSEEKRGRVLLVDPDVNAGDVLQNALGAGWDIRHVRTGEEGYAQVEVEIPELVITEAALPGMNGYELTRKWRSHPATHTLPILMLTGNGEIGDKVAGFEAGVD